MTDNDLVKRLREPWYGGPSRRMAEELEAANRIEALTEQLEDARLDAKEAEAYSVWLEKQLAKAADVIELALIRWDEHYEYGVFMDGDWVEYARAILAEAKGHKP